MIITEAYAEGMRRRDQQKNREFMDKLICKYSKVEVKKSRKAFISSTLNMFNEMFKDRIITIHQVKRNIEVIILSYIEVDDVLFLTPLGHKIDTKKCRVTMAGSNVFMTIHAINRVIQTENVNYRFMGDIMMPLVVNHNTLINNYQGDVKIYTKLGLIYANVTDTIIVHTFIKADKLMNWKKEKYQRMDFDKQDMYI